jgi:hypothetical protein
LERIEGFTGYFEFLRIDFPSNVFFEGELYSTASHAYNAARTSDPNLKRRILKAPTLSEM